MYLRWNGYEIDGSDTTYNLILPNRSKLKEVAEYYLSLPIWDRSRKIFLDADESSDWAPHRCIESTNSEFDIPSICAGFDRPDWSGACTFVIYCLHPEKLPEELRSEIYALSSIRPGAEGAQHANVDPVTYLFDYRDSLAVGFIIYSEEESKGWKPHEPDGLVFNRKAIVQNLKAAHAERYAITLGPGFIFEYTAYILQKLSERFSELGIDGGRDCEKGFVYGCTLCVNLY